MRRKLCPVSSLLSLVYTMIAPWQGTWAQNPSVCCHSNVCPAANIPKNCNDKPNQVAPAKPPASAPSAKASVNPIIYKPIFFKDDNDVKEGTVHVGVCIYLGAQRDQPAQFLDYNWEQIYYTFTEDTPDNKACEVKQWQHDPCPRPVKYDDRNHILYRPEPSRVKFTFQGNPVVKESWHTEYLFRDLPRRKVNETFTGGVPTQFWRGRLAFDGVPAIGMPVPLVSVITYGFVTSGPFLTLLPLKFGDREIIHTQTFDLSYTKPVKPTTRTQDPCIATKDTDMKKGEQPLVPLAPDYERFRLTLK